MSREEDIAVVLSAFDAVMARDAAREQAIHHPELEFHWPASMREHFRSGRSAVTWNDLWDRLQPTERERQMSPRVVAANNQGEVVVLWQQRGLSPSGERFECPVLGLYQVRDGKFARAQMFYFDSSAVLDFLDRAQAESSAS